VPAEITGDPERLHQVLMNLIGNAIKFTNQGGVKVKVSLPQEEMLSIEVADTGPGIPDEQLPDIFEVFRRGSNYAQRERQGAGLGLSITKEIITRMGGEIFRLFGAWRRFCIYGFFALWRVIKKKKLLNRQILKFVSPCC